MSAGQSSIFGAVEEKGVRGFSRMVRDEAKDQKLQVAAVNAEGFRKSRVGSGKSGRVGRRNIHSRRTGNAEKAVASG